MNNLTIRCQIYVINDLMQILNKKNRGNVEKTGLLLITMPENGVLPAFL